MMIFVNQLGYLPSSKKRAILAQNYNHTSDQPNAINKVQVLDSTGTCVLEKTPYHFGLDEASEDDIWQLDFSELTTPGTYVIQSDAVRSYPFTIGSDLYTNLNEGLSKALYFQRCGMQLEETHAGKFARKTCHLAPSVLWEEYIKLTAGSIKESDMKHFTITGGWHDAGDFGRYSTAASVALAHILYAYRLFPASFTRTLNLPESGNGIPDILNECLYELKWLLKMQDEEGGVYHKQTTRCHVAFVMPCEDTDPMILFPVSSMAVADFAAVMALASRVYKEFDADFSKIALEASLRSYQWLLNHPEFVGFRNPEGCNTGEYGDRTDIDERLWAATELYRCTNEVHFLQEARILFDKISNPTKYGWGDVSGFAGWALLENILMQNTTSHVNSDFEANFILAFREAMLSEATHRLEVSNKGGYGVALLDKEYVWGSNMAVLNHGMLFGTAYLLERKQEYLDAAVRQMDYILGVNAVNYSYVSDVGEHSMQHPHNRVTEADGIRETIPGFVSGGPNGRPNDETAKLLIPAGTPPMKCYADDFQCYSLNEITIYWNSPAIFTAAFLDFVK